MTAALRGGPGVTAVVAVVATSLALVVGAVDQSQAWLDHTVAVILVAAGGALATVGAALRARSARLVAELTRAETQLDAILANLGEAVVTRARDGSIVYANQAAADLLGLGSPEELKATDAEVLTRRFAHLDDHGVPLDESRSLSARALAGEEPEPMLVHRVERATGRERWLVQKATPVRDGEGRVVLAITVFENVTAVRRAERHQRLLAEASKLIASSLDFAATLDRTAWALVPDVADWAIVDLPDERRVTRPAAIAHLDARGRELLRELRERFPPVADDPGPAAVLRDGDSLLLPLVDDADMAAHARDDRHLEMLREIGTRSVAVVAMPGAERILGTITLGTAESGRALGEDELALAEELGRRAGVAIENARRHTESSSIARTLQRSLLPPRLPVIPGITLAARFRAAGGSSDVGGDFYDLFAVDGGWMVVVGDVTGKGPVAAALTSLVRYTIRTAATYERSPGAALERLNAVLLADPDGRQLCTAVCVRLVPGEHDATVEIARGGHPPPFLLRAGEPAEPIGRPGPLLGGFAGGDWDVARHTLGAGEGLVLYTDGVTDARGTDDRFGFERLAGVLTEASALGADEIAGRVDAALLAHRRATSTMTSPCSCCASRITARAPSPSQARRAAGRAEAAGRSPGSRRPRAVRRRRRPLRVELPRPGRR